MDNKNEPILSAATKLVLEQAFEEANKKRMVDSMKEAQDFHKMLTDMHMDKVIVELGVLHEALQENSHLAAGAWGKSIILVAADIIREYGKVKKGLEDEMGDR